jgi:hypothetical protein
VPYFCAAIEEEVQGRGPVQPQRTGTQLDRVWMALWDTHRARQGAPGNRGGSSSGSSSGSGGFGSLSGGGYSGPARARLRGVLAEF